MLKSLYVFLIKSTCFLILLLGTAVLFATQEAQAAELQQLALEEPQFQPQLESPLEQFAWESYSQPQEMYYHVQYPEAQPEQQNWTLQAQDSQPQTVNWDVYDDFWAPEEYRFRDMQFRFSLLYLKPSCDQSSFAISSTNNRFNGEVYPNGKRHLISYDFKPGFRAEGLFYISDCNHLDLRFTYFSSNQSDSASGDFLFDTIGFPGDGAQAPEDTTYNGRAHIKHHFRYYAGDATLNRLSFDCCPDNITFLFGLQYIHVSFKQRSTSKGFFINDDVPTVVDNLYQRKSTFWGIGPQIGVDYNYLMASDCCLGGFGLNARARGSLLCSRTHADLHYFTERTGPVGVNLRNEKLWRVNPTMDAQLSISYQGTMRNKQVSLELGYEFLWCHNCIDKITGYDVAFAGDTLDAFDNLNLHGPYVSLNVGF